MKAKKKEIPEKDLAALGVTRGRAARRGRRDGAAAAAGRRKDPQGRRRREAARAVELARLLHEEAKVL